MPPVIRLEKSISHRTRPTRYARAQPGEGRRSTAVPLAVLLLALAQWIGPGVATSGAEVSRDYRDYLLVTESAVHIQNGSGLRGTLEFTVSGAKPRSASTPALPMDTRSSQPR